MSKSQKHEGIVTEYNSTRFRSRLEARWAAFFDLLRWEWEYEPFDLNGWIPDFALRGKKGMTLVEVKPTDKFLPEVGEKMIAACPTNPEYRLLLVGIGPFWNGNVLGIGWSISGQFDEHWGDVDCDIDGVIRLWRLAGNKVQWSPPPPRRSAFLSGRGEAALDRAVYSIVGSPPDTRDAVIKLEAPIIADLIARNEIPAGLALECFAWAARKHTESNTTHAPASREERKRQNDNVRT